MPVEPPRYKLIVNGFEFILSEKDIASADIVQRSASEYHFLYAHQSLNASLVHIDRPGKKLKLVSENRNYEIQVKDPLDQQLEIMGFGTAVSQQLKEIKAPMPGLVLEVHVKDGSEVKDGDKLLILEAMKMENSIMIHNSATVKKVNVVPGQAVDKGQVLIELE